MEVSVTEMTWKPSQQDIGVAEWRSSRMSPTCHLRSNDGAEPLTRVSSWGQPQSRTRPLCWPCWPPPHPKPYSYSLFSLPAILLRWTSETFSLSDAQCLISANFYDSLPTLKRLHQTFSSHCLKPFHIYDSIFYRYEICTFDLVNHNTH